MRKEDQAEDYTVCSFCKELVKESDCVPVKVNLTDVWTACRWCAIEPEEDL
ncbi:MAG: hypothetical protein FWC26_06305 [Fibromonadales bacterium]|nr:hypothetical protein [Fibromonadales bacterium]